MITPPASPFIALACGGTGGHLFPGLAVAEQLTRRGARVALLISPKDVDQDAVKTAVGLAVFTLPAVALQRGSRLAFLRGFWNSWRASRQLFKHRRPDAVLAMGGFTSAPPVLAARAAGIKTYLHESNAIPGRANRWLAPWVDQAFIGFAEAAPQLRARVISHTGTPVRHGFRPGPPIPDPSRPPGGDSPTVLIMGGSQGASGVNNLILAALPLITGSARHWRWVHLTGPNDFARVKAGYVKHGLAAEVHPFLADVRTAMATARAAVSRAGASSLAELAAVRLPAVLIPFPAAADDHQRRNARAFADTGAARVLDQTTATPATLLETLQPMVEDPDCRRRMQLALAGWDAPHAADAIATAILAGLPAEVAARTPAPQPSGPAAPTKARAFSFGLGLVTLLGSLNLAIWKGVLG